MDLGLVNGDRDGDDDLNDTNARDDVLVTDADVDTIGGGQHNVGLAGRRQLAVLGVADGDRVDDELETIVSHHTFLSHKSTTQKLTSLPETVTRE